MGDESGASEFLGTHARDDHDTLRSWWPGMMSADVLRAFAIAYLWRNVADFRQELG